MGSHLWFLKRISARARGIYNRVAADDRFASKQIPPGVQWRLSSLLSASGYSANQLGFGSHPLDFSGRGADDEDSLFAQDILLSGQAAHQ